MPGFLTCALGGTRVLHQQICQEVFSRLKYDLSMALKSFSRQLCQLHCHALFTPVANDISLIRLTFDVSSWARFHHTQLLRATSAGRIRETPVLSHLHMA